MNRVQFERANGEFIQSDTSLNTISYVSGVIAALGALDYNVVTNMDTGNYEAWKDGVLHLVFFEIEGRARWQAWKERNDF